MHLKFMNETMYFNGNIKDSRELFWRTFRRNYGKLRDKDRTDSPTLSKSANKHIFFFLNLFKIFSYLFFGN